MKVVRASMLLTLPKAMPKCTLGVMLTLTTAACGPPPAGDADVGRVMRDGSTAPPPSNEVLAGHPIDSTNDISGIGGGWEGWTRDFGTIALSEDDPFIRDHYNAQEDAFEVVTPASEAPTSCTASSGGGVTNLDDWRSALGTPPVRLEGGRRYQIVIRFKADVFPFGQNIHVAAEGPDPDREYERAWNVSQAGVWEEVIMPVFPATNGDWSLQVWTYDTFAHRSTPSTVLVSADVDIAELPHGAEVVARADTGASSKEPFESSAIHIDWLGNVYTRDRATADSSWEHVFPMLILKARSENLDQARFDRYRDYGFNGVADAGAESEAEMALAAGLRFIGVSGGAAEQTSVIEWAHRTESHDHVLWHWYDNIGENLRNQACQAELMNLVDELSDERTRYPILSLDSRVGLPRASLNASRRVLNITGSDVGHGDGSQIYPTLAVQFMTQSQRAPVTMMTHRSFLGERMVPSIVYGLIQGGRALQIDADDSSENGSRPQFWENPWADGFRQLAVRIDGGSGAQTPNLLPLLRQPQWTSWSAETNQHPTVHVGTRDLGGVGHLILASFAAADLETTVFLRGISAECASDYFSGEQIASIADGRFRVTLGHGNEGYRIVRLACP